MSYSRLNDGPRSKGLFHSEFLQNGLTPSRQMHVPVELTPARFEWGLDNYNILRHWTGANTPTMCCGNECLWQVWLPGFSLHCSISARWFLTILYCNQDVLYIYIEFLMICPEIGNPKIKWCMTIYLAATPRNEEYQSRMKSNSKNGDRFW